MEDREAILGALPVAGTHARPVGLAFVRSGMTVEELWDLFFSRLEALNGRKGTLAELDGLLSRPHILDQDAAALLGRSPSGAGIWDAEVGVTSADVAIAETGSLLLSTGPGRPRLLSLTPPMHIVLIPKDRIVATLAEGFSGLSRRTTVMITGPSRTADIEGVLVRGVHGPGEIVVVPV